MTEASTTNDGLQLIRDNCLILFFQTQKAARNYLVAMKDVNLKNSQILWWTKSCFLFVSLQFFQCVEVVNTLTGDKPKKVLFRHFLKLIFEQIK